jgi:ATP-binding cassette, subfamily B, multidrug efflux pump
MTESAKNIFEEKALGKSQDSLLIRQLIPYIKPYWFILSITVTLMVAVTALELLVPYITKIAIDRYIIPQETGSHGDRSIHEQRLSVDLSDPEFNKLVKSWPELFELHGKSALIAYDDLKKLPKSALAELRKKDMSGVMVMAGYLLLVVAASFCLNFILVAILEYAGQMIMHDLRMALFIHIQNLSIRFFTQNPVGRLVTRVANDTQNMQEMFNSVIIFVLKDLFLVFGIIILLFYIDWRLALAVHLIFPFVLYAAYKFSGASRESYRTLRVKAAQMNSRFAETVGGIQVIQLFNQERNNYQLFSKINHENYEAGMQQITVFAMFMPFIELMSSVAVAVVIFYGGSGLLAGEITLGAIVAFISYLRLFFRPIRDIAEKYNITLNALSSSERIMQILSDRDMIPEPDSDIRLAVPGRVEELRFHEVTFSYVPNEIVLDRVSFILRAEKTIAIVGPTGAGKTSIINLITRFYDPDSGKISINGKDIKRFSTADVRSKMALVTQDPFLFSGAIKDNIFNNENHISPEKIDRILTASYCKSFIEALPEGIDTVLTEGGATLSSGQRQLISIARALAADPELIIFDEATSYIDSDTESKIQTALFNLTQNRTAIIIAHRLSTARVADNIIVLHHGKIIESGSHGELMDLKGFYYRLNQLQG